MKYYYNYFELLKYYQQIKAKTSSIAVKHLLNSTVTVSKVLNYLHSIASKIKNDIF